MPSGTILNIEGHAAAGRVDASLSQGNALYAIEMKRGWFAGKQIEAGRK
jgi:hypothetical protein